MYTRTIALISALIL